MQSFLNISNVVDGVRSSAGSALKSVQSTFEEQALKAAGLGEDEEVLYRLNKHAQAYLRAAEAMQQAAEKLAQDFTDALEDIALRDIARKFRESSGSIAAQQSAALKAGFADPVREACDAENYARRQQLVYKAFDHFLKSNSDSCTAITKLSGEVRESAQKVFSDQQKAAEAKAASRVKDVPIASSPERPAKASPPRTNTPANTPASPNPASFDDLLGDSSSKKVQAPEKKQSADLLDFGFDDKPTPTSASNGYGTNGGHGTSSPLEHVSFDFAFGGSAKQPSTQPSTSNLGDLDFGMLNGSAPRPSAPSVPPPAPAANLGGLGGLGDFAWPSKEDEDESCIKARVESWQKDKNLRTMLVTLHEVAPSNAGWTGVQLDDLQTAGGVKQAYRKAVLAVHPDKNQGKPGEKLLAHFVFQALRDQWTVFNTSG